MIKMKRAFRNWGRIWLQVRVLLHIPGRTWVRQPQEQVRVQEQRQPWEPQKSQEQH